MASITNTEYLTYEYLEKKRASNDYPSLPLLFGAHTGGIHNASVAEFCAKFHLSAGTNWLAGGDKIYAFANWADSYEKARLHVFTKQQLGSELFALLQMAIIEYGAFFASLEWIKPERAKFLTMIAMDNFENGFQEPKQN